MSALREIIRELDLLDIKYNFDNIKGETGYIVTQIPVSFMRLAMLSINIDCKVIEVNCIMHNGSIDDLDRLEFLELLNMINEECSYQFNVHTYTQYGGSEPMEHIKMVRHDFEYAGTGDTYAAYVIKGVKKLDKALGLLDLGYDAYDAFKEVGF